MKEFTGRHFLLIVENSTVPLDPRVWREACTLRDAGAKVSVICPALREHNAPFEELDGIQVHRYRPSFSDGSMPGYVREYGVAFLKTTALLHRVLFRGQRPDVVHVANPPDIFWPLALYLRLWGTKFIFDEHDLTPETYLSRFGIGAERAGKMYRILVWMEKLSYRLSHAIVSTNESYKAKAIAVDASYAKKTFVVRNGPDTRTFLPTAPKPEYRKGRRFLAAYMGVMAVQDGVDYIVRAVDILVRERRFTDFIVYIIGTGDEWNNLRAMTERLGLNDYIVFPGYIPRATTLEILSTADVCLSPDPSSPLNDLSTMNKVMEYMALGKTMVSFDLKEARFSAGESAYYVTNNDPGAFADGMAHLFLQPDLCKEMGEMGRRRVDEALCWQIQAKHLLEVYRFVLSMTNDPAGTFVPKASPALGALLKLQPDVPDLPDGERSIEYYLYERYLTKSTGWMVRPYYELKPLIPRALRTVLRRIYARVQKRARFPSWPVEPVLVNALERYMITVLETTGRTSLHRIAPWPAGARAAFVITHDVEFGAGFRNINALVEIEKRHGFRSSWNIVPERYPIDWPVIDRLRADGFEIGVHGLRHDGMLFRSQRDFQLKIPRINKYIQEWGACGFRSESTLRNADWMPAINALYDSSYPDTDPYEPHAGGCCSIWPYFIGDLVELPITLPQDHTLFEILRHADISVWQQKSSWIEEHGGCILIDVHPDYTNSRESLRLYESFLAFMKMKPDIWHALPRDVAQWWKVRNQSTLRRDDAGWSVDGPAAGRAAIVKTSLDHDRLRHEIVGAVVNTTP